jgi:hypothetical protein
VTYVLFLGNDIIIALIRANYKADKKAIIHIFFLKIDLSNIPFNKSYLELFFEPKCFDISKDKGKFEL